MKDRIDLAAKMATWAAGTPVVSGMLLIGSRERPKDKKLEAADEYSDWDFQIITSKPQLFANSDWTKELQGVNLIAYATRTAQIGGVPKINAIFSGAEADFVIIPLKAARLLRLAIAIGFHRREGKVRRRVQDLAEVIRPGWRFLKGGDKWDSLFSRVVAEVPDPRLDNAGARAQAEIFVCEYLWCRRKVARGEFRAAQRVLYQELLEINLKLLHELRRRRGLATFTKARRVEKLLDGDDLQRITLSPGMTASELNAALEKSAHTLRGLMQELVGPEWRWPILD